ncbi:hypothetical protein [Humibacillus xanthopallidus]|uniref:hypothetical protein n=1 Tax=Humibacillus xanthopallidus TaxID=412689 RepID=UPI00114FB258|nr:hypothetical protein [Humibacillus xanthopallidus]
MNGVEATTRTLPSGGGSTDDPAGSSGSGIDAGNDIDRAGGDGGVGSGPDEPGPKFPMTLRRTGGIAGFDDRVVVEISGRVVVNTRLVHDRTCTLTTPQRLQLMDALTALRATPVQSGDVTSDGTATIPPSDDAESDPITLSVTDDLARSFDLTDSSLGGVSDVIGAVVTDVTLTTPASARCTTPTATATTSTGVTAAG